MYNPVDSLYKKAIEINGVKATINNIDTKILIKNENAEYGIDYKKIISSTSFQQGNYVFINGVQYLIVDTEEQLTQSIYNVGTFRKVNHVAKFVSNETIYQLPCISTNVTKDRLAINYESVGITEGAGIWSFIAPLNDISKKIVNGKRFLINGNAWKVVSRDYTTQEGIFYTILKQDSISMEIDDLINGVADGLTIPKYTISLNSNTQSIKETGIYQIVATVMNGNQVVSNPNIKYSSSDESVATVNDNGVVSALKEGSCIISATIGDASATLSLTVTQKSLEPVISYSYTWSNGSTGLKYYNNTTFTATKTIDGVVDPNLTIAFAWDSVGAGLVSGNKVTMTKKANNQYTIKNVNVETITNCTLTWTDVSTGTVIYSQPFQFRYMS